MSFRTAVEGECGAVWRPVRWRGTWKVLCICETSGQPVVSMGCEEERTLLVAEAPEQRQEPVGGVETDGRWPWRLASAKKRVATYRPNPAAGKMEGGAVADAALAESSKRAGLFCRRLCVSAGGGAIWADLGSSSLNGFVLMKRGFLLRGGEAAVETETCGWSCVVCLRGDLAATDGGSWVWGQQNLCRTGWCLVLWTVTERSRGSGRSVLAKRKTHGRT